ncbi:hypothetical protein AAE478_009980 [Parahypoxylon ruwenzoriense]
MATWRIRRLGGPLSETILRAVSSGLNTSPASACLSRPLVAVRTVQHRAFDAAFDQDELAEARRWHASFDGNALPKGQTCYSRSSGPGGQHVNKTDTKATTVWSVEELSKSLPTIIRSALRTCKYYSKRNDSITIQAQTQRSRSANTEENHTKLVEELLKICKARVPGVTSPEKIKKHEALSESFRESRLKAKKAQGYKKASRKGRGSDE